MSFNVDGSFIATSTLSKGVATCTYTSALNTGAHTFVATYNGDSTYAAESFSALQVVTPPIYPTTTVLVASPTSVDTSQTVGLTATVSSTVSVQSGVVTFMDGNSSLGSQSLYQTSTVRLDTNLLSPGTHNLTAVYQGYQQPFIDEQAVYQPSTSAPVTVTVNANATTTALSASVTSLTAG